MVVILKKKGQNSILNLAGMVVTLKAHSRLRIREGET